MLAYAANRRTIGKRESSPNALLLVISVHVALLALAMSARSEFPTRIPQSHPLIEIPVPLPPPPPNRPQPREPQPQPKNWVDHTATQVPLPHPDPQPPLEGSWAKSNPFAAGGGTGTTPDLPKSTATAPLRHDPQLLTPAWQLKPPYPASKLVSEEEATLRLRLTIDETGRVTAVDPVGNADREFLDSARRYILGHWRYQPASEDGRAVASIITVTLQFRLDG
jgi:periplasmic protein TonB